MARSRAETPCSPQKAQVWVQFFRRREPCCPWDRKRTVHAVDIDLPSAFWVVSRGKTMRAEQGVEVAVTDTTMPDKYVQGPGPPGRRPGARLRARTRTTTRRPTMDRDMR